DGSDICQHQAASAQYANRNIAGGAFDGYLRSWARAAKAWGKPFFLRPNHEMNGNWYPWGTGAGNPNNNTPEEYVAAWKHLHALFDAEGVTNAVWVWCPNVGLSMGEDYPGDGWVDWVGLDGYNWGDLNAGWLALRDVFGAAYAELLRLTDK